MFFSSWERKQVSMHMHFEDMREVFCPIARTVKQGGGIAATTSPRSTAMFGKPGLPWFEFRLERRLRELKWGLTKAGFPGISGSKIPSRI